jgi:hypothetical protein
MDINPPDCPSCGVPLTRIAEREKTIVSLMGEGEFRRTYYECSNGHGHFFPCDDIIGVTGTAFTPGVRLVVSKLAAAGSFEWTSEAVAETSEIYVSPKEIQRISETAGKEIEAGNKVRIESVKCPEQSRSNIDERATPVVKNSSTMYIEYDGTGVPMIRGELVGRSGKQPDGSAKTREVKLGCFFTQSSIDKDGNPIRDKKSASYVGLIENSEEFGWRLFAEASRRNIEIYKRIVIIGDGAKWIWSIANQHFPSAIQIVDLYHAKEHLYKLADNLFPNNKDKAIILDDWIKTLEAGEIEALIIKILWVTGLNETQNATAITEANFFAENAHRMRYEMFKCMGLFVGSGVIEAGCKNVIGNRLKQSGMFWCLDGANAIAALRCADLSCNIDFASIFRPKSSYQNYKVS